MSKDKQKLIDENKAKFLSEIAQDETELLEEVAGGLLDESNNCPNTNCPCNGKPSGDTGTGSGSGSNMRC